MLGNVVGPMSTIFVLDRLDIPKQLQLCCCQLKLKCNLNLGMPIKFIFRIICAFYVTSLQVTYSKHIDAYTTHSSSSIRT
jgi:hypothetical protein